MKKFSLIILISLLFATTTFAAQFKGKALKTCVKYAEYIALYNNYNYNQGEYALYVMQKNFNVDTNLSNVNLLPPQTSATFKNTFLSNQSMVAGQAIKVTKEGATTLCGIISSCECEGTRCNAEISVAGTQCSIEGDGTQQSPYLIVLQ